MIKELLNCEIHWTQVKTDTNGLQMLPEEEFNFKRFRDLIAFLFYFHFCSFVIAILFYFCKERGNSSNLKQDESQSCKPRSGGLSFRKTRQPLT